MRYINLLTYLLPVIADSETHSSVVKCNDATRAPADESYPAAAAAAAGSASSGTPRAPVAEAAAASSPPTAAAAAAAAALSGDGTWTSRRRRRRQHCCIARCTATVSQRALHLCRASETAQGEGTTAAPAGSHLMQGTVQPAVVYYCTIYVFI